MSDSRPEHSEWGASGAHRWMACPGSIALGRGIENVPSFYAEEGTVAHKIAERCLRDPSLNPGDFVGQVLQGQAMEIEVTEEMADAVTIYVQTVRTDKLLLGGMLYIEREFDISELTRDLYGVPQLYGRNDACLFVEKDGHLIVYDYKHGRGHAVEVENNPQLLYYGLGAVLEHDRARKNRVRSVELVIVQPRAAHPDGPVRRQTIELFDLLEWQSDLIAAVKRTLSPKAPLVPGEHCLFCRATPRCPALHKHTQELAVIDFKDLKSQPPAPEQLTLDEVVSVLNKADLVEQFISAVRHHAHTLALAGIQIPGWKIVKKRPRRIYTKPESEVAVMLMNELGIPGDEIYTPVKLKSVAQIEEVLKRHGKLKGVDLELWKEHWQSESSGTVLAPEDDPRPALPPPAIADFAHLKANDIIDL